MVSQAKKDELFLFAGGFVNITLNGEPAVLMGRFEDFPSIAQIRGPFRATYSWEAVEHILNHGGDFEC